MALKTYPNGLRLSLNNKKGSKLVSVDLHITAGTQSEKNYESGISEYLSRMLLMGTEKYPTQRDLVAYAKNNGILLSRENNSESIVITATTTNESVSKAIQLLYEIAFESAFDEQAASQVRNGLLADIAKLQENPSYVLERMVNQALFYRTGLANPKFGTNTTISRMTANDAKEFMQRVLTPKNTIISVVGEVDVDEVYEKVMQTFYSRFIQEGEFKKLKYVAGIEDFKGGERTKNKKLNQSRIFLAFPSVSYKSSRKYALDIICPIIERKIRESLGKAAYFHAEKVSQDMFANNGKLTIETMVDYDYANNYLDKVVDAIKNLLINKISLADFENEKNAYIIKFLQNGETANDLSKAAAREVAINKQSYSQASELMKIELLTIGDANKVMKEVFDFSKLYIAYLGNPIEISASKYLN